MTPEWRDEARLSETYTRIKEIFDRKRKILRDTSRLSELAQAHSAIKERYLHKARVL